MTRPSLRGRTRPGPAGAALLLGLALGLAAFPARAQQDLRQTTPEPAETAPQLPSQVEVESVSSDAAIARRLASILRSTTWFEEVEVTAREGVVFLDGRAEAAEFRKWAGDLATKTRDVVAVVNRIRVSEPSPWNLRPALEEVQSLWEGAVRQLPLWGLGLMILVLTGVAAKLVTEGARRLLDRRLKPLVRDVAARAMALPVFVLGLYVVLQVAGLSRLAATVLGGTGVAGLVAGFAFRDILENFLASVLISVRNPFRIGDLVEISGHTGVVQRVTTRGTVLMDLDGNHVQIPNGTVYKSLIRNFTANPNRREAFEVGIGYEQDLAAAQAVAIQALSAHSAVLADPEPLVLVDRLGAATVNLKAYFWYDGTTHNGFKVRSALIRRVKRAFQEHGISMPDEAREVVFPEGVPVRMLEAGGKPAEPPAGRETKLPAPGAEPTFTPAEGEVVSEQEQLREQASRARNPEEGADLLEEGGKGAGR